MADEPALPRFLVRQGTVGAMVYDREKRRAAMWQGREAVGLTHEQAIMIRDHLTEIHTTDPKLR